MTQYPSPFLLSQEQRDREQEDADLHTLDLIRAAVYKDATSSEGLTGDSKEASKKLPKTSE